MKCFLISSLADLYACTYMRR